MSFTPVDLTIPPPSLDRPPPGRTRAPVAPVATFQPLVQFPQYGQVSQREQYSSPHSVPLNKSYAGPPPYQAQPPSAVLYTAPPQARPINFPPLNQPPPTMAVPPPSLQIPSYPTVFMASKLDAYQHPPPSAVSTNDYYTSCMQAVIPQYTYAPPPGQGHTEAQSMYDRYAKSSTSKDYPIGIPDKYKHSSSHSYDKDMERYKARIHDKSPGNSRHCSRSHGDRDRYYRDKYEERHEEERRREYELRKLESSRYEMDRRKSPSRRASYRGSPHRSSSRRSPSRYSPPRRSERRSPTPRNPSRRSPSYRSSTCHNSSSRSHSYTRSPSRRRYRSRSSESRGSSRSNRELPRSRRNESKPMTDREKILEEYRRNYCRSSKDFIEKMEKWSKEHDLAEEETPKTWYRSSPATLHYKLLDNKTVEQTDKLEKICDTFRRKLIDRGRKARPEVDELPPLSAGRAKSCRPGMEDDESDSSSSSDDELDAEGLQGYSDRVMLELQRKQSHPRRLHPEMWFNNTGEMNGGPLCRCSARARRHGMRHGVYAGEDIYPKCNPKGSNMDKLYHYRITVSPPTNFLIKAPTIIGHDEHEFIFSGFSMFTHSKLATLPTCTVIRFNIEYTILYIEEPAPVNFTIEELDLFEEFLFYELLELVDLDLGRGPEGGCSQFHFMPRFVRSLQDGGVEVLSMCEVIRYLLAESRLLIPPDRLQDYHRMDHYSWQKFVDGIKGMIVTYPGKKPCSVRVDQLDRSPPFDPKDPEYREKLKTFYPEIVHFGVRPPQLSYAGNPEYQKAWRFYVKYRHLIANMSKPSTNERQKLAAKEAKLQEMRTQSKMKRDVTVAISSQGFYTTGLMCDVVQHAMLIPVLVRHLRFHKSLDSLEKRIGYVFKQRALLQTALTHPSYRENFGTNPDHARNSLTNCGIRQPEYGDRRIHYTRKKGIVTLINIMSRFGKHSETESAIKHNERLEFLGDAVVEFLTSIHLFKMFPDLAEGGLATYRAAIVQNQHLAQLAKNIGLEQYMRYAHGSDLCRDVVMRHAMANCFEALMGALYLDGGNEHENLEVADRVFALALFHSHKELLDVWTQERAHPLQEQEPLGDRKYIKDFEFLQKLTEFEDSIGLQFKHIRLLARAFTDRSVGFTHLTLGSNQRLEFLGDTVLQLVVSTRLYKHFPEHHEGHLSLLRSSLVNNRTQAMVCDDLNMSAYAIYNNPKAKPTTKKHKADLLEAFLGALYVDKNIEYCEAFCNAVLFPRLQEFIMNQDWNDPKSKLQQCCLTLRSMEGGEPHIPFYKVIECLGPTNTRVYTVAVYFRGVRLAAGRGHCIQEAEMNAAEEALNSGHELFPQLDHQKRVIAKSMKHKKHHNDRIQSEKSFKRRTMDDKLPRAYRSDTKDISDTQYVSDNQDSSNESDHDVSAEDGTDDDRSTKDSGFDIDSIAGGEHGDVKVTSLLSDMERLKGELIIRNKYETLKEKVAMAGDTDDDDSDG